MIPTDENSKKPFFGPDLGSLDPNLERQLLFIKLVGIHCPKLLSYPI